MLYAQFLKRLCGGLGAPGLHVLITLPDACNGLLEVLLVPFQILGQSIVERVGGVLPATLRVLFQLGFALRLDRYYIHDAFSVETAGITVKPRERACCINGFHAVVVIDSLQRLIYW
jgi:hypothetical protein